MMPAENGAEAPNAGPDRTASPKENAQGGSSPRVTQSAPEAATPATPATASETKESQQEADRASEPQPTRRESSKLRSSETPAANTATPKPFSWFDAHPTFVIILVGPDEVPFGIHKDFLCSRSTRFREMFGPQNEKVEHIVHMPDATPETFGFAQHFLYTGRIFPDLDALPSYETLIGVWKIGSVNGITGLCARALEAMEECRRLTETIPAAPLLVQVWKDTPEGASIRQLLLGWAAEYMRSSESRADFAKSLPQEVLSELVVAMSALDSPSVTPAPPSIPSFAPPGHRKGLHPLDADEAQTEQSVKRARYSDASPAHSPAAAKSGGGPGSGSGPGPGRPRIAIAGSRPVAQKRKVSNALANNDSFTTEQKLLFCSDLITRMLSGPGFWTRLVGPFREPVDPVHDNVPDYFHKVKRPMDLGTIKAKMDRGSYTDEEEFRGDMQQIFDNCYTYWSRKDPMWAACEKLQKTFEEKYSQMNKWIAKMAGDEVLL